MSAEVEFRYGVLCDDLEKQANEQGYTLEGEAVVLEKLRNSANMVRINKLLTNREADSMYKKLHNKVLKALKPLN